MSGSDAEARDIVRGDLERPVRERGVNPVGCSSERPPVVDGGCIGRGREVELLVRAHEGHHESALEVLCGQHTGRVRGTDGLEAIVGL